MSTKRFQLSAGVAIAKDSAVGEAKWNKVFLPGTYFRHDFPNGSMELDRSAFETMIANWKQMGGNALPVDRHHWGDSDDTRVSADDKIAVGWMEDFRVAADGSLESLIKWNSDGREDIEKDRRRYFSPSFAPNFRDTKTGKAQGWTLFGGGLLNDPFLTNLPRMAASRDGDNPNASPTEHKMNKHLLAALALIGLTDSSTEADVTAKQKELEADKLKLSKLSEESEKSIKLAASRGEGLEAMKLQLASQAGEVQKLKDAARDSEIDRLNETLVREGRITAAEQEDVKKIALAMGIGEAKTIFGKRTPIVKFKAKGHNDGGSEDSATADATGQLEKIADEIEAKEKVKPSQAIRLAASRNPELYKASKAQAAAARAGDDA